MTSHGQRNEKRAAEAEFPAAIVRSDTKASRLFGRSTGVFWLLALAALFIAVGLTYHETRDMGTAVTVQFQNGHGLKPEDAVRYRGINIGFVESVRLGDRQDGLEVVVNLHPEAESFAREGTQFWIERPQISLSRMSGLETVVGAKYLGVSPGPVGGPSATEFVGLENPPRLQLAETSDDTITIRFRDGNGISSGDTVRYRGIVVGEVTEVRLERDLTGVIVKASLTKDARNVARKGSVFWVERVQVGLKGVRGLDTLVGGKYLAVRPGPIGSVPMEEFVGADEPPAAYVPTQNGIAIRLVSEERYGLERGVAITYRGLTAGQITSVQLTTDAHAVALTATIFPEYRSLVRTNTQFWNKSGVDFHFGLRGVDMEIDPMSMLKASGIAFATPEPAGEEAPQGHTFRLANEETAGWTEWRPSFDGRPTETTVGRGQRFLNRIRSPFGGGQEASGDCP